MIAPDAEIDAFLAGHGWGGAKRALLAGDASPRRYERLTRDGERAVLMDARRAAEAVPPFVVVARHLSALGYSAPRVIAGDEAAGLLLLEDLGDTTFTRALSDGAPDEPLYAGAVELLCALHRTEPPRGLAPYDEETLLQEADLLADWYRPAVTGQATADTLRDAYRRAWRQVLSLADLGKHVLVLRDYHADNLMWMPARTGLARVGLLDFQDARLGSAAYDLVSLLEDARRDVPVALAEAMIARYLAAFPNLDPDRFRTAYAVLGAQRNAKIIGIFTRLCRRDGKPGYLGMIPRVWRLLEGDLGHPALAPIKAWFDAEIPPALRRAPDA